MYNNIAPLSRIYNLSKSEIEDLKLLALIHDVFKCYNYRMVDCDHHIDLLTDRMAAENLPSQFIEIIMAHHGRKDWGRKDAETPMEKVLFLADYISSQNQTLNKSGVKC